MQIVYGPGRADRDALEIRVTPYNWPLLVLCAGRLGAGEAREAGRGRRAVVIAYCTHK